MLRNAILTAEILFSSMNDSGTSLSWFYREMFFSSNNLKHFKKVNEQCLRVQ